MLITDTHGIMILEIYCHYVNCTFKNVKLFSFFSLFPNLKVKFEFQRRGKQKLLGSEKSILREFR